MEDRRHLCFSVIPQVAGNVSQRETGRSCDGSPPAPRSRVPPPIHAPACGFARSKRREEHAPCGRLSAPAATLGRVAFASSQSLVTTFLRGGQLCSLRRATQS